MTKGMGNFSYGAYKNWLFMSLAHFSIFLLICKSSLYIKDIKLSSPKADSKTDSHAGVYWASTLGTRP